MEKEPNPEKLYDSMKSGFGKFYKQAKDSAGSSEAQLKNEIETIKTLRTESRRYVRPRIHAQGGMKMIISSTDRLTRRQIAIAKMKENKLTKDSLKLFLHEARVLARLDHPNIVPLHDIGIDPGGEPYFTMKLLSGESLGAILKQLSRKDPEYLEKYPDSVLLDIFLKVCDAVAFAHSRNIVHRDLKPDNIQVSDYGEVLLCDWGLAKDINLPAESTEEINLTEILSHQTMHGTIKGTPGFMAPEQFEDDYGEITERTDIYALGCILYSLLTFCRPVESDSLEKLMKDIKEGNIIPVSERNRPIPVALEAVIHKAMSITPNQRYDSVKALAAEVRGYLDGFATKAQKADFRTQLLLLIKRHIAMSVSIAVSFIIIICLVAFFLIKLKERETIALNALNEVEKQKVEKENLSKMAAPEFLKKAAANFKDYQFNDAYEAALLSKNLDDSQKGALFLLGKLQIAKLEFFEAATNLSKVKKEKNAAKLIKLAVDFDKEREVNLVLLIERVYKAGESHLVPCLVQFYHEKNPVELQKALVFDLYRKYHNNPKSPKPFFTDNDTGLMFSKATNWKVRHLNFFKGMKLNEVNISKSQITDIRGLVGMPLKKLNISNTSVSSWSYLRNLQLEEVNISSSKISEIHTINKMPVKKLNLANAPIKNYGPLEDFNELTHLIISKKQESRIPKDSLEARGVVIEISEK